MRKGGGKQKGNSFERKVCRIISIFWSNGKYDDLCWRSASSGARGTTTKTKVKGYHGDLVATSPLIEVLFAIFCTELKHYKDLDITEILRGIKNPKILIFWKQTLRAARKSNRTPILIYKTNYLPELVMCEEDTVLKYMKYMKRKINFISLGYKLLIFNLQDFIDNVDKERFIRAISTKS